MNIVGSFCNLIKNFVFKAIGYLIGITKLKNCLCKLLGYLYVNVRYKSGLVVIDDFEISGDYVKELIYLILSAPKLYGNSKFGMHSVEYIVFTKIRFNSNQI